MVNGTYLIQPSKFNIVLYEPINNIVMIKCSHKSLYILCLIQYCSIAIDYTYCLWFKVSTVNKIELYFWQMFFLYFFEKKNERYNIILCTRM